jgi:hypothetical protein
MGGHTLIDCRRFLNILLTGSLRVPACFVSTPDKLHIVLMPQFQPASCWRRWLVTNKGFGQPEVEIMAVVRLRGYAYRKEH